MSDRTIHPQGEWTEEQIRDVRKLFGDQTAYHAVEHYHNILEFLEEWVEQSKDGMCHPLFVSYFGTAERSLPELMPGDPGVVEVVVEDPSYEEERFFCRFVKLDSEKVGNVHLWIKDIDGNPCRIHFKLDGDTWVEGVPGSGILHERLTMTFDQSNLPQDLSEAFTADLGWQLLQE